MNDILIGALLFFICSTGIFGYVSYDLSEQKGMAVQALQEAQDRLADSEKSLKLQIKSCEISDSITSEYQVEKKAQQDKNQAIISKIDTLPKKVIQASSNEINDINIDSKLPDDLVRLLSESCLPNEGDSCVPAR
ncbi:hypothetical protein D3C85_911250 [compost metagenome]